MIRKAVARARSVDGRQGPGLPQVTHRCQGIALLMVLLIVMAITIISTGFVARMDTELVCGGNTLMRIQMDQLAESGLEHARGLILHPQDVPADQAGQATYWKGEPALQIIDGSRDYYDVSIQQPDPADDCTYDVKCAAYRKLTDGTKIGQSRLEATLRLDPCVALGVGAHTTLWNGVEVDGDAYCKNGSIDNGRICGDVFATGSTSFRTGQLISPEKLPPNWWPPVTLSYSNSQYDPILPVPMPFAGTYVFHHILYYAGNLDISERVTIKGMLFVKGDLTIHGSAHASQIVADKNLPALYVSGKLAIEDVNDVWIQGLVVVGNNMSVTTSSVKIDGGLFVGGTLEGTLSALKITVDPIRAAIVEGTMGSQTSWSPAVGGFFKSIRRWE